MNDLLYLTGFKAENFRCFGSVNLEFSPSPGVVILVGPNGLGKTSWFEAVEIALTGEVARWKDIEHRVKVDVIPIRHGANCASVNLAFGGQRFEDSSAYWSSSGDGPRNPRNMDKILCANPQSWGLTHDNLAGFLRATHVFPQSASVRALHKPPVDRWEQILRHVSGFDQLSRLSENLGQGVLSAVTHAVTSRELRRLDRVQDLEIWQERVAKLRAKEAARRRQGDVLGPREAAELLLGHLEDLSIDSLLDDLSGGERLLRALDVRIGALRSEELAVSDRLTQLEKLNPIPVEWMGSVEDSRLLNASLERSRGELDVAERHLSEASTQVDKWEHEYSLASVRRDKLAQDLSAIDDFFVTHREEGVAREAVAEARQATEAAHIVLAASEERLRHIKSVRERRRMWELVGVGISERRKRLELTRSQSERLRVLTEEYLSLDETIVRLSRRSEDLEAAMVGLRTEAGIAESARREAERSFKDLRAASETIQNAVSKILESLKDNDHECPVCQAGYHEDGELVRRARNAISLSNPRLAQAERELRNQDEAQAHAVKLLERAVSEHSGLQNELRAIRSQRARLVAEAEYIRATAPFASPGSDDVELEREANEIITQESLWHAEEPKASNLADQLESQLQEAEAAVHEGAHRFEEAGSAERHAKRRVEELAARRLAQSERLQPPLDFLTGTWRESVFMRLTTHEEDVANSQASLAHARATRERQKTEVRTLSTEAIKATTRIEQNAHFQQHLEEQWMKAMLTGTPSAQQMAEEVRMSSKQSVLLGSTLQTMRHVSARLGAWLEDLELRNEREILGEMAGGIDDHLLDTRTAQLRRNVEDAALLRGFAERTQTLARQLADASMAKKESFCRTLQNDLEEALVQLLPLLIKDSMFHDIIASIETSKRSTAFTPRSASGFQIEAVASEGQLSGLGFSVQLAMASTFPWSRWRGLLLDDPLQYSDIVHTSNLVEVLRLLALQHGFQIFISTHERSLADYVYRKFRNAGLSAERVVFREAVEGEGMCPVRLR